MKIKRLLLILMALLIQQSVYAAEPIPSCGKQWCDVTGIPNIPGLKYKLPTTTATCPNPNNPTHAMVMLHGAIIRSAAGLTGSDQIVREMSDGEQMNQLGNWLDQQCTMIVAPNAGIKQTGWRRWDTDNQFTGGVEKQQILNLMSLMDNTYGVSNILLMGGSSGSMMVHNIAHDNNLTALKAVVMADGLSAYQTHYVDLEVYPRAFIDALKITNTFEDCSIQTKTAKYINGTRILVPTRETIDLGMYLNEDESINFPVSELGELPTTLFIYTTDDTAVLRCMKEEFGMAIQEQEITTNDVTVTSVPGIHDGSVWQDEGFTAIQDFVVNTAEFYN